MFTRHVITALKPNCAAEFTRMTESEILPLLRRQKGFSDLITFIAPDGSEAIAISFWDTKESADAYNLTGYPEALKVLLNVVEGTPQWGPLRLPLQPYTEKLLPKQPEADCF